VKTPLPTTPAEWQFAVDGAAGLRAIADCRMYGLIEGGPEIDINRCDELLELGRRRGIVPSQPDIVLARQLIAALNEKPRS
jgi:hypothetical protein